MSLLARLSYLFLFPLGACVLMLFVIPGGIDAFSSAPYGPQGMLSLWALMTMLVVNIHGLLEQRFLSTLLLFVSIFGVVVPTILLVPAEHVNWGTLRIFTVCFILIPLFLTVLSGYRKVPQGFVMKVRGNIKAEGERFYYLPLFMAEPLKVATKYHFTMNGNVVDTKGVPMVLSCSFACALDPLEAVHEGIPFEHIRERAQEALRNVVSTVLAEHAHPVIGLAVAMEHILVLKKGFSLPSLGEHAHGAVEHFFVKFP